MAVETSPIALDPPTHAELEAFLRKGQAEFHAFTPQQEARIVLVTRKNIKVRSKSSRMGGGASTLYKQGYQRPVTAVVDERSPQDGEIWGDVGREHSPQDGEPLPRTQRPTGLP